LKKWIKQAANLHRQPKFFHKTFTSLQNTLLSEVRFFQRPVLMGRTRFVMWGRAEQ